MALATVPCGDGDPVAPSLPVSLPLPLRVLLFLGSTWECCAFKALHFLPGVLPFRSLDGIWAELSCASL